MESSSSPSLSPVHSLSPEVAAYFEEQGLVSPVAGNKRTLSAALLPISPSSTASSSSGSVNSITSASFSTTYVTKQVDSFSIPDRLESQETLEYLGFLPDTAAEIWQRFLSKLPEMDDEIFDFANYHVETYRDWGQSAEGCELYMVEKGINPSTRKAILLPEFADIRSTASCVFWVKDTMEMRFSTLKSLNKHCQTKMVPSGTRHKRAKAGSISALPSMETPTSRKRTESIPTKISKGDDGQQPVVATTILDAPAKKEGYTMLFHGGSIESCEKAYNEVTGEFKQTFASYPGDFSGERALGYWTPQRETADRYAQYAKHRSGVTGIAIIQVAIPQSFIESLKVLYLWFNRCSSEPQDAWKQVVWHSRGRETPPRHLDHLHTFDLWIGHIAAGINAKYAAKGHHSEIKESDLLTVNVDGVRQKAIQWAFYRRDAVRGFVQAATGNGWIHRLGSLQTARNK